MKKIYSTEDNMMAGHIKSILQMEGIDCLIKNQHLSSAMGEIPPIECWPEIWIHSDEDYDRAMKIVTSAFTPKVTDLKPWRCHCGEEIEAQFTACWQCGSQRQA